MTADSGTIHTIEHVSSFPFDHTEEELMRVSIELSNDKNIYIATLASVFDLLASIGGFIACLVLLARIWLYVFTFNEIENFLVSKLFKNSLSKKQVKKMKGNDDEEPEVKPN